ncbi:meiosis-specific serine threonine kinase mek1 [Fusarium sp. NRRL 52700]|nr:meiosis-specific serine threonine kinase mek1 [Fusarium sp. NRRL 52700]
MHKNLSQLLQQLGVALEESTAVVSGERLPFDEESMPSDVSEESDDETSNEPFPSTELSMRVTSITDILNNLYRVSYKIRNSSLRPSSTRARLIQAVDSDTGIDLFDTLYEFDSRHLIELLTAMRQGRSVGDGSSDVLLERLATSNVLRRKQFRYWERHAKKLAIQVPPVRQTPERERSSASAVLQDVGLPQAQRLEIPPPVEEQSQLSETNATPYDPALDDRTERETVLSLASTALDADGKGIEVPKPPEEALHGDPFTCPYCWVVCPAKEGRGKSWKSHVLHDLRPYGHLSRDHDRGLSVEQLQDLTDVSRLGRIDDRDACPICFKEQPFPKGLTNHLANHLERISLFSLPRTISSQEKNVDESQLSRLFNIDSDESSPPEQFEEEEEEEEVEDPPGTQSKTTKSPTHPDDLEEPLGMLQYYAKCFIAMKSELSIISLNLDGFDKFALELASTEAGKCLSMTKKLLECNFTGYFAAKDGDGLKEVLRDVRRFLDAVRIELDRVREYTLIDKEKQTGLVTEGLGGFGIVHNILEGILQVLEGSISLTTGLSKIEEYQSILATLLPAKVQTASDLMDNQLMNESIEQPPGVTHKTLEAPEYDETLDPRYRTAPSHMFQPGEVFKILWPEPTPGIRRVNQDTTYRDQYSELVYVSFRRFIVVANDSGHCTCV